MKTEELLVKTEERPAQEPGPQLDEDAVARQERLVLLLDVTDGPTRLSVSAGTQVVLSVRAAQGGDGAVVVAGPATVTEAQPEETEAAAERDPLTAGVRCAKGHFNDPMLIYCGICGLGLTQTGREPVRSIPSSLGVLVLDDGTTYPLNRDHVFGRDPEQAEEVRSGEAAPVRLTGPTVSDLHMKIKLDGWTASVIDLSGGNGLFLRAPGTGTWTSVQGMDGMELPPGGIVSLGGRQLRFDSHRKP
ncbi:FHA domain-containing protein [Nonomuraea candida]|uniref:FHA domain-containing protein n=1 Tax=Nonomuraea candida TaxID=359159 RepID=UPI0005BD55B6|nr:FHA domain-containing protein [Nonomuraea candida]